MNTKIYEIGTPRVEDGRSVGQRIVHGNVLEKSGNLMTELGEAETALAIRRWRDGPGKVPGPTALKQALENAQGHRQTFLEMGMVGDAAYCEIAAYCVQACLDEVVVS